MSDLTTVPSIYPENLITLSCCTDSTLPLPYYSRCNCNCNCIGDRRLIEAYTYLDCSSTPSPSNSFQTPYEIYTTFFAKNLGFHTVYILIQTSPDNLIFANDFEMPMKISPGETKALVPAVYAKFTRLLAWTDALNTSLLYIYYQSLI